MYQHLQHALNSRIFIEQAKGVVAYLKEVQMSEASILIRDHARCKGVSLADVAERIVNRTLML